MVGTEKVRQTTPFEESIGCKLQDQTLSPHQFARLERFVLYDRPPTPQDEVDTIIVMGGIPFGVGFKKRLALLDIYRDIYPGSQVIFTGDGRDRRGDHDEKRTEAEVMAKEAIRRGLGESRVILEPYSKNAKENVDFSLLISGGTSSGSLFLSSHLMARRIDYYVLKELSTIMVYNPEFRYFIVDADVPLQNRVATFVEDSFTRERAIYEWLRLPEYRRKGDI